MEQQQALQHHSSDDLPMNQPLTQSPDSNSTLSSDSSLANKKTTRDLPNLSDCHSCGSHINHTNPRDRLQPLDSMWRIVLLCKKCIKRVDCSDICPYCFLDIVDKNDCFSCLDCHHSVHKECVERFGSGLGSGVGFRVCVDCWVPDAIAKSIRRRKSRFRKRNDRACEKVREVKPKVVLAVKARDFDLNKARVGKIAVVDSGKGVKSGEVKVVDDVELAFLLHRAMNSSPRISRYSCGKRDVPTMVCYSRRRAGKKVDLMDVPLVYYSRRYRKGLLRGGSVSLDAPLVCYSRRGSGCKGCCNDGLTSSAGLKACDPDSSLENSLSGDSCQESDQGRQPFRYLLKYYRVGKGKPRPSVFAEDSGCCSCMDSANLYTEGMLDTRNNGNGNECLEISENCDVNNDRFLLKYKRSLRHKVIKPDVSCKVEEFSSMLPSQMEL